MKDIYEGMNEDEFMSSYRALYNDTDWYNREIPFHLMFSKNKNFNDTYEIITYSDFLDTIPDIVNKALCFATDVFGKINIPLIGRVKFGDLIDAFCDKFNGIRLTIEQVYVTNELDKLYETIDESTDGVVHLNGKYFKYL